MVDSLTLALRRPERPSGVKVITVTWNGDIEMVKERGEPEDSYTYLFEMLPDERAERLERLRGRDGQETPAS